MALRILLSGAAKYQGISSPLQSLGKYPSSVEVENASLNNLFPDISRYTIQLNKPETRAIVVFNDSEVTLTNLRVYFTYPQDDESNDTNDAEYQIGYVDLEADSCGDPKFPYSITTGNASPYGVTFHANAIEAENALDLPDLPGNSLIGIWIKRTLKSSTLQPMSNEDLLAITQGELTLDTLEEIELTFSWD